MHELIKIERLRKRDGRGYLLAVFAIAAIIAVAALPASAQAFDPTFRGGIFVGLAKGQTIRVHYSTSYQNAFISGSASTAAGHVRVFNGLTGSLLWSRELPSLTTGLHTVEVNRDDLREEGEPDTGRIQLWIELVIDASQQIEESGGMDLYPPSVEMVDKQSGTTTGQWTFFKLAPGTYRVP